jgi:hypothetical protein
MSAGSFTYCLIRTTTPGVGNIFLNPLFRNSSTGNFELRGGSPAIDRGRDTGSAEFASIVRDYEAVLRGFDGDGLGFSTGDGSDFDIGALEFSVEDANLQFHSADTDEDFAINLSELLRIIQFFNSGGYRCVFGTEDGYAPGLGTCDSGSPHDSDYLPQDFVINLSELLRMAQYFNAPGGYVVDEESEDGYRPVFPDLE